MTKSLLRQLPRVDDVLARPAIDELVQRLPRAFVVEAVREVIDEHRAALLEGVIPMERAKGLVDVDRIEIAITDAVARRLDPALKPLINATGVVLHTNLGRAPLSRDILTGACEVAAGYSNLEYSLEERRRGSRYSHSAALLQRLTGAEDSLVVNNNAGAVVLTLMALCRDREVIVSRGELIEIGGSFRIPDICATSGAKMVEVGTTNRTHLRDYANAITDDTAALIKVHRSNFDIVGFTKEVNGDELSALAKERGVLSIEDLGSGSLVDLSEYGLETTTARAQVEAGLDIVTFSGDKLLGGPQAGVIVGRRDLVSTIRKHPLTRALRVDKLTLAVLERTLLTYVDGTWRTTLPALGMLTATPEALQAKAENLRDRLTAALGARATITINDSTGRVGGGSLPLAELKGRAVQVTLADGGHEAIETALREGPLPIVCRIDDAGLHFDVRTIEDHRIEDVANRLQTLVSA